MSTQLQTEYETFEQHRHELLAEHRGKYVLIKGTEIVGVYHDQGDAVNEGYRRFGNVPFLVHEILEVDRIEHLASGWLEA